jgi:copper transport protein
MIRLLGLILVLVIAGLASAGAVAAHAVLIETAPADGAVLAQAPAEIILHFNEAVSPISVRLLDGNGKVIAGPGGAAARDNELHLALPARLSNGGYLVTYRVISLDSHPVGGSLVFTVGPAGQAIVAPSADDGAIDPDWQIAVAIDRVLYYVGLFVAAGGVMFHAAVAGDLARLSPGDARPLQAAAVLAAIAGILGIGLEGGILIGGSWRVLFAPSTWRLGIATSLGLSLMVALAGLALMLLAIRRRAALPAFAALVGAGIAVCSLALTGHAATAEPRWIAGPTLPLHVLAIAFWLGSLLPLRRALQSEPVAVAAALLRRFSRRAIVVVTLLTATGLALATIQLRTPASLLTTEYGNRLAVKLGLVALLLLLAALNKLRLTPALAAGQAEARHRLLQSITGEAALALAILAATGWLGQSVPPRALAAGEHAHHQLAAEPGFAVMTYVGGDGALIEVAPAVHGPNSITIHLYGADGAPLKPQELAIEFAHPDAGIEPFSRIVQPTAAGLYHYSGQEMSLPGRWKLTIDVLVSEFERRRFETMIPVH